MVLIPQERIRRGMTIERKAGSYMNLPIGTSSGCNDSEIEDFGTQNLRITSEIPNFGRQNLLTKKDLLTIWYHQNKLR
jgi:hypothetical protein